MKLILTEVPAKAKKGHNIRNLEMEKSRIKRAGRAEDEDFGAV